MAGPLGLSGLIAACTAVPDAVNPVEWYRSVAGLSEAEDAPPVPGADQPFPNLASVPERPTRLSTEEERRRRADDLVADREHALYLQSGAPPAVPALQPASPDMPPAGTIFFGFGSASLSPEDEQVLRDVIQAVGDGGRVRVVGYAGGRSGFTDPVRHRMANFNMSVERANAVARELIRLGLPPQAVFVEARTDEAGGDAAQSRRVEVYLES